MAFLAYAFEAKSIQSYITAGGRLRDLSGGSAVVDALCEPRGKEKEKREGIPFGGLLDDALDRCGFRAPPLFTRRAAGAFTFISPERDRAAAEAFSELWPLVVNGAAPGLEFVEVLVEGEDQKSAIRKAVALLRARRNIRDIRLPLVGPPVARAPRTGEAAAGRHEDGFIDRATARKRRFRGDSRALAERFLGRDHPALKGASPREKFWPTEFESEFPFGSANRTVAVVHADANRMGQIFKNFGDENIAAGGYAEALGTLSDLIKQVTERALHEASRLLTPEGPQELIPARPVLAGGDDVSIILRADLALPWVAAFVEAFEKHAPEIVAWADKKGVRAPLPTFTAGVAFVNPSQPFSGAHALAESLCKYAKRIGKKDVPETEAVPSMLAFHRVTASLLEDYDTILRDELTIGDGDGARRLTANPYKLGKIPARAAVPALDDLMGATTLLLDAKQSRGALRRLIGAISSGDSGERLFERWIAVQTGREGAQKDFAEDLRYFLENLCLGEPVRGIYRKLDNGMLETALGDVLSLYAAIRDPDAKDDAADDDAEAA